MEKNRKVLVLVLVFSVSLSVFGYFNYFASGFGDREERGLVSEDNSEIVLFKENVSSNSYSSNVTPPESEAYFHFTSVPDLFNWNIYYPQPGWENAMDWFLGRIENEGAFMLNAGDIMDARWWGGKEQVRSETKKWWGAYKRRFEDKGIELYPAPGDHEYGDDQGLSKMDLVPVYAEQFSSIFNMPENGPTLLGVKGIAYSFSRQNSAFMSVITFENSCDSLQFSVLKRQVEWLGNRLERYENKGFILVQGHVPVFGPVESKNSSANMLEEGVESAFWKTMVEHGVDVYLCGEHHRITAKKRDGIWQVVHGALWGTQNDVNYLRGSVYPGKLKLELFRFPVRYNGGVLENHPHRLWINVPREQVIIPKTVKDNGPTSVGELVIKAKDNNNQTIKATGEFFKNKVDNSLKERIFYIVIGLLFIGSILLIIQFLKQKKIPN